MSYEKTVWAGEGTLAREQEYNYHWCYERGIITKAWLDVHAATGDRRFYDAAKANVDQYVTEDGAILTYEPEKYRRNTKRRAADSSSRSRVSRRRRRAASGTRSSIPSRCGWTAFTWPARS